MKHPPVERFQVRQCLSDLRLFKVSNIFSSTTQALIQYHDSLKGNVVKMRWLQEKTRPYWLQCGTWLQVPGSGILVVDALKLCEQTVEAHMVNTEGNVVLVLTAQDYEKLREITMYTKKAA